MTIAARLRRIAINQQGLLREANFGRGKAATLRAIEHIGYVQIDTISVVERAHHHVLWSRVPNYRPGFLDQLVKERQLFEYWFHAAAWLPMRDYRFSLPRMHQRNGERNWYTECDSKLIDQILRRVGDEGPLRARDFEDTRLGKKEWWDWKPAKQALEQLFMQGDLMVTRREGFQKVYDLPERVLPVGVDTREPDIDEFAAHLVDINIAAHGLVTLKSSAYLRKGKALRLAINDCLQAGVESGKLSNIRVNREAEYFVDNQLLEGRAPAAMARVRILSPFDNLVIQRERLRELFQYNYQIECYVPEPKRQFGYFCLPLLYRDKLVGRLDCKVHRKHQCLEIKAEHIEKTVDAEFGKALQRAILEFARFNGCSRVESTAASRIAVTDL
ncbi:MAG: hypothetical protein ACI822_001694 [Gammaproteobacteria bacterium]|jgi:uncharacterized protein YcaQ